MNNSHLTKYNDQVIIIDCTISRENPTKIKKPNERTLVRIPNISFRENVNSEIFFKNGPRIEIQFVPRVLKIIDCKEIC